MSTRDSHERDGAVDLSKVYEVVTGHMPALLDRLGLLIAELERDVGWREDDDAARTS